LYDLLYCRKHGLDPLAAQNTARNLCYKDDYAGFRNESIPALSQPGAPYRAVETEGGVALFRCGERGDEAARSFFAFLTAHPDSRGLTCGVETLRIYDVELSEEQYSSEACLPYFDHEQMRFVPRHSGRCDSVLQRGCCLKEYDMRAGAAKLAAAPDSGTEASSEALRRLLTVVTLRHIVRNGYEPFCWGGSDFPGYDFPFADRFKNADRKPAAAMTDDSRTTAADILRTCFGIDPAREEPPCPLPSGDIRFYRDFLSIDLLFRPERLLERYERDRDRREMPCHILKH